MRRRRARGAAMPQPLATTAQGMKSVDICMPTPGVSWYDRCFAGFSLQVCRPEIPCLQKVSDPQFFGKDDKMSFFAALIMGAQHALGMTGGIVTTPSLVAGDTCRNDADPEMCESMPYLINATLLASGLLTLVQVFRFKLWCLPGNYYIGTGLVSVSMHPLSSLLPPPSCLASPSLPSPRLASLF